MQMEGWYRKMCRRWNVAGQAHGLTFSCAGNRPILTEPQICGALVEAIEAARSKHDFRVWGYVFMPEHVHLLIFPRRREYSISAILADIKRCSAMKAAGSLGRRQAIWQRGGGYDRNLSQSETVAAFLRYVHLNPVRRGLVRSPLEWEFSSARSWAGRGEGPVRIDRGDWPS